MDWIPSKKAAMGMALVATVVYLVLPFATSAVSGVVAKIKGGA